MTPDDKVAGSPPPLESDGELKNKLLTFWDESSSYYQMARGNNLTLSAERKIMLKYIRPGDKVLDVGCGSGENSVHISGIADYTGLEYSSAALEMAQEYASETTRFLQGDAENLPFEDNNFDVVLSTHVIEHLTHPEKVIAEEVRVCKPGGRIMIIGPSWELPWLYPPSCITRAKSFGWRFNWTLDRAKKLLLNDPSFDMIENPDVLEGEYIEDNDTTYAVSVKRLVSYLKGQGYPVEFALTYRDIAPYWGHHGPQFWFWSLVTMLAPFKYANGCLLIVVRKPA